MSTREFDTYKQFQYDGAASWYLLRTPTLGEIHYINANTSSCSISTREKCYWLVSFEFKPARVMEVSLNEDDSVGEVYAVDWVHRGTWEYGWEFETWSWVNSLGSVNTNGSWSLGATEPKLQNDEPWYKRCEKLYQHFLSSDLILGDSNGPTRDRDGNSIKGVEDG